MNKSELLKQRSIRLTDSLSVCLKRMDSVRRKSLLVFQGDSFLEMVSIGDIQRAIIAGADLNSRLCDIPIAEKQYASPQDSLEKIKKDMFAIRAECMPVVDEQGNLCNVYFWDELFAASTMPIRKNIHFPVVIMAGGKGVRMRPLTNVLPKPLIPLGNKTIIERIIDHYTAHGVNRFFLSVNYKAEMIRQYFDALEKKYEVSYFQENKPLGTAGSLSLLKGRLNEPFFVCNCDIMIEQDYNEIVKYHQDNGNELTLVAAVKSYQIPYGTINISANGLLTSLQEKPDLTFLVNAGMYLLEPGLLDEIPSEKVFHITDLIEKIRARGGKVGVFPVSDGSWYDIGNWPEYNMTADRLGFEKFQF